MIEHIIRTVLAQTPPSSGDDLLGFQMDAEFELENEVFSNSSVQRTGDPACLLHMEAELARDVGRVQQLHTAMWDLWRVLRYPAFEASHVSFGSDAAVLRFITAVPEARLCVTGRLVVGGEHYARLHRKGR